MADLKRRVKLYTLNEERQWDDRGTGHVTAAFSQHCDGDATLIVRAESDGNLLLESRILSDTAYQKQQETLIVWSEGENTDLALSFQEKIGCDEIWEKICQVQGKDPSVDITQDISDEGEEDEDSRLDDSIESLQRHSTSPYVLPPCELSELDEIADLFSVSMQSLVRRDQLARAIEDSDYIPKLVELFKTLEDLENTDGLNKLYEIVKGIFMLNRNSLFDTMIQETYVLDIIGCLEYDPALPEHRHHREYLSKKVNFKEVLPIKNPELKKKIHQTFILLYIQESVLPTPSVFDENMLSTLSSAIFFNKVEIVNMIQDDDSMLPGLFKELSDESCRDERRRELAGFIRELCSFSQTLQPTAKDDFFKLLNYLGILQGVEALFASDDTESHRLAIDIFAHVVEHNPSMVRDFAHKEYKDITEGSRSGGDVNGDEEFFLLNMIIEQMICDPDPELSCAMQLTGLLKVLLDPENMMANKNEKSEFLGFFYRHCMHVLMAPVLANTADDRGPSKDDYQTSHLLSLILELITFSVEHHTFHVKSYILNKDLLRRVLVLLNSKHTFLALAALRFTRKIVSSCDEFYNRYIIKGCLFQPIVDTLFKTGRRYNLLNSVILEMFEFIRVEDIKSLTSHIVETYHDKLKNIDYVKTFTGLKLRYDQQQNRDKQKSGAGGLDSTPPYALSNSRFRRDVRAMEEEEELWFDREDDDDAALELDASGDSFDAPKINIDSILESDNGTKPQPLVPPVGTADAKPLGGTDALSLSPTLEKPTISVNIKTDTIHRLAANSNGTGDAVENAGKTEVVTPPVKNGLVGLVDYSDDESEDEDPDNNSSTNNNGTTETTTDNTENIPNNNNNNDETTEASKDAVVAPPTVIPPTPLTEGEQPTAKKPRLIEAGLN